MTGVSSQKVKISSVKNELAGSGSFLNELGSIDLPEDDAAIFDAYIEGFFGSCSYVDGNSLYEGLNEGLPIAEGDAVLRIRYSDDDFFEALIAVDDQGPSQNPRDVLAFVNV